MRWLKFAIKLWLILKLIFICISKLVLMRGPEHVLTDVVEHPHIAVLVLRRLCDDLFDITNQNWNNIFNYSIYSLLFGFT